MTPFSSDWIWILFEIFNVFGLMLMPTQMQRHFQPMRKKSRQLLTLHLRYAAKVFSLCVCCEQPMWGD